MKVSTEMPPMLALIRQAGMDPIVMQTAYTYGDTLYNPGNHFLPDHFLRHEECHSKQQGKDPDAWWSRYLTDPYFRIDQEAEAFAVQYVFFKKYVNHDRNAGARFLYELSGKLSSPTYGKVIGSQAAQRMIQGYAGKIRI